MAEDVSSSLSSAPQKNSRGDAEDPPTKERTTHIDEILLGCLLRAVVNKCRCESRGASIQDSDPLKDAPSPTKTRRGRRNDDEAAGTAAAARRRTRPPPNSSQESAAASIPRPRSPTNTNERNASAAAKKKNQSGGRIVSLETMSVENEVGDENLSLTRRPTNGTTLGETLTDPHDRLLELAEELLQEQEQSRRVIRRRRKVLGGDDSHVTEMKWRSPFDGKNFKRLLMVATAELSSKKEMLLEDAGYFFLDFMR
jgi:hypothetical protein